MAELEEVTKDSFKTKVLEADLPVLVDFWADWCAPCHLIAPLLAELAEKYAGRMHVVKLDVTANAEAATQHEVMSIPTLLLFRDGKPGLRLVGADHTVDDLSAQIDEALAED